MERGCKGQTDVFPCLLLETREWTQLLSLPHCKAISWDSFSEFPGAGRAPRPFFSILPPSPTCLSQRFGNNPMPGAHRSVASSRPGMKRQAINLAGS